MKTFMTVCLGALVAMPAVALAQTSTTTTTETPAQTAPAPATEAPATPAPATEAPATTSEMPADTAPSVTTAPEADTGMMQPDPVEYVTTEAPGSIYVTDLVGQSVYGTTDEKTGDINDLLMDEQGNVKAAIIGVGGFIGLGEKDVAVTLESLTIRTENDEVRISIDATEQELEEAPVFTRADGTSSDRLGAFERAYNRTANEAGKAIDEASRRANELYEKGKKAVNELTTDKDDTTTPAPTTAN